MDESGLTPTEKRWLRRLAKQHPDMDGTQLRRVARAFAASRGEPDEPTPGERILETMGPLEKGAMGAGVWALRRWFRREIMPELVNQPSAMPTRKTNAAGAGSVLAGLITFAAVRVFGLELKPEEALILAGAVSTIGAYVAAYMRRDRATMHRPE